MSINHEITSEVLGPVAEYLIGRWFAKVEEAKTTGDSYKIEDAYANFWFGLSALQKLSVACPEAVYFGLALTKPTNAVANMIEKDLGIDPYKDRDWKF